MTKCQKNLRFVLKVLMKEKVELYFLVKLKMVQLQLVVKYYLKS